jgi:hypothetical protein
MFVNVQKLCWLTYKSCFCRVSKASFVNVQKLCLSMFKSYVCQVAKAMCVKVKTSFDNVLCIQIDNTCFWQLTVCCIRVLQCSLTRKTCHGLLPLGVPFDQACLSEPRFPERSLLSCLPTWTGTRMPETMETWRS